MTAFEIYLVMQIGTIGNALLGIGIPLMLIGVFGLIVVFLASDGVMGEIEKRAYKGLKVIVYISIPLVLLGTLTPTTKTALTMYTVPAIVNNKEIQVLPGKLLSIVNQELDKLLKKDE